MRAYTAPKGTSSRKKRFETQSGVTAMQQNKMAESSETQSEYIDELKPGTKLLQGQYTIDSFLNSGGFGITYLAKDSLDRRIVIKECFPGSFCRRSATIVGARSRAHQNEFKSIVKLFMQEARSLAKLVHPNIVGVHQVFEDNDTAYMAIDFIEGRDMLDMIEDSSVSYTPEQIVEMTKKLLSAVAFIHENEVLHRDISPDNILIQPNGEPILIDFGAAREQATKASRALSALRVVKDGYSPQEFYVAGSAQGPWSDLYAFAASLFHLITGEAPVNSQVRLAAVAEGRGDPYEPLAGKYEGYPEGFLEAIDKAMQTVPAQRVQNAQEWLDMFQNPAGKEKIVPLKVEKADATKAVGPQTAAKQSPRAEAPKAEPVAEASKAKPASAQKSGGGMKMALMGTAALVVVAAGIGFMTNSGGSDSAETAEALPVLSTPPAKAESTTAAAKPAEAKVAASEPETPATAASKPPATKPTAATPVEAPKIVTAEPKLKPMVNAGANTFADIMASKPVTVPTTTTPKATASQPAAGSSSGNLTFDDIVASKPAAVAPSQPAAAAPANPRPTTSSNTSGNLSFADIIASKPASRPSQATVFGQPRTSVAPQQVDFAVWNVDVPFDTTVTRRNGRSVALITNGKSSAELKAAVSWVQEGVEIIEVDGAPVSPTTSIGTIVLNNMNLDANGVIRTPVKIKRVGAQNEVNETLVLSANRQIALSNGVELEARFTAGKWQTKVTKAHADTPGLKVGDVLLSEKTTGMPLNDSRSIETIMSNLATGGTRTAQFEIQRDDRKTTVAMNLK